MKLPEKLPESGIATQNYRRGWLRGAIEANPDATAEQIHAEWHKAHPEKQWDLRRLKYSLETMELPNGNTNNKEKNEMDETKDVSEEVRKAWLEKYRHDIHPAADALPRIPSEELEGVAQSIRDKGLFDPIETITDESGEEVILDGRHRYWICRDNNIEPKFKHIVLPEGVTPVDYVMAKGVHRRHLGKKQREAVIVALRKMGDSIPTIAAKTGASTGTIHRQIKAAEEKGEIDANAPVKRKDGSTRKPSNKPSKPKAAAPKLLAYTPKAKQSKPASKSGTKGIQETPDMVLDEALAALRAVDMDFNNDAWRGRLARMKKTLEEIKGAVEDIEVRLAELGK